MPSDCSNVCFNAKIRSIGVGAMGCMKGDCSGVRGAGIALLFCCNNDNNNDDDGSDRLGAALQSATNDWMISSSVC